MTLVWRWKTVRDPDRPFETEHAKWGKPRSIPHPLAERAGQPVRELCRGANGSRLLEFEDGLRVVAPFYSVARVEQGDTHGPGCVCGDCEAYWATKAAA
ncbi:hypothetical protein DSM104299_03193 [Baekduia alba]|uniref:hypothetical protein n=1 Tax=Baekduia alba TaxID=2997333 RepID=UPI0023417196|nr:hypothetical protein [Baekduia alba]WCB94456.1 hypothetical protein DSM104299_03193 [Baekduia alba]